MIIQKRKDAFTLLEVMLAVIILSVSLMGLMRSFFLVHRSQANALQQVRTLFLLEQKIHDLEYQSKAKTKDQGVFAKPNQDFQWKTKQKSLAGSQLKEVNAVVFWGSGNLQKELDLSTAIRPYEKQKE